LATQVETRHEPPASPRKLDATSGQAANRRSVDHRRARGLDGL
jgi:hypothetical protein